MITCWTLVVAALVFHSAGELAGLHRGAGASWTPGASASAQTPRETAADATGKGAADCIVQLHMMAPESSSSSHSPSRKCARSMQHRNLSSHSLWRWWYERKRKTQLDQRVLPDSKSAAAHVDEVLCDGVIYEYLYERSRKVSFSNQDWAQTS